MTPRVLFLPAARADAHRARRWYNEQLSGLGNDFAQALDAAVSAIGDRPASFQKIYGEFRQCVMRRFPYTVFFRIADTTPVVVAVQHQRQDPAEWQSRTG